MNIARLLSEFRFPRDSHALPLIVPRHAEALILLARVVSGISLVASIAAVSRLMYALTWRTDATIAAVVAAAWVAWMPPGVGKP
jgi:hypothetical protein